MCPNDYVLHACRALSNLKGQSCMDTILVTILGVVEVTIAAGGSSKKIWMDEKGERWTKESSIKQ